jgi:hypothetical protein
MGGEIQKPQAQDVLADGTVIVRDMTDEEIADIEAMRAQDQQAAADNGAEG